MAFSDVQSHPHPCPKCGHCPTCGRSNAQPWGYRPQYPTWGQSPPPGTFWPPKPYFNTGGMVQSTGLTPQGVTTDSIALMSVG